LGLELLARATPPVKAELDAWARYVFERANDAKEIARKSAAAERVKLYRDDYKRLLEDMVSQVFAEPVIRQSVLALLPLISGTSFVKRVANELARPIYARAPIRRVLLEGDADPEAAQESFNALAGEMTLTRKMSTAARYVIACGAVLGLVRYVEGVGMQLDVMTPDMVTVVSHPDVPTKALAIAYVKTWHNERPFETVVWDDQRYFSIDAMGRPMGPETRHDFGLIPFLEIHQDGRTGCYWQETIGQDLVSQTRQSMFMDLVLLRKVKTQSHLQVTYTGDSQNFVKKQVLDELSVLHAESGEIDVKDLQSDPAKYIDVKLTNEATVAAAYGISRERLNQQVREVGDDLAYQERVAELAGIMAPAEADLFEIVKALSRESKHALPADARLVVDLGQIHHRVDREAQLRIRAEEAKRGSRSGVDDVLEDNPEYGGDRELAKQHIRDRMGEEAEIIRERRALNMPEDATAEEPGQDPAKNGAMGPAVRDGKMTRDEAAEMASKGPVPDDAKLREIAKKVLRAA
jgi:hypothetical protein